MSPDWTISKAQLLSRAVSYTHLDVYKRQVIGSGEDAVGVYLDIVSDGVFFDTVYAQSFLYDTMRNLVRDGVDLSRLTYDTASPTLTFAENPGPELSTGWDLPEGSATRDMTQAELDALWGQELRDLQEVPILTCLLYTSGVHKGGQGLAQGGVPLAVVHQVGEL